MTMMRRERAMLVRIRVTKLVMSEDWFHGALSVTPDVLERYGLTEHRIAVVSLLRSAGYRVTEYGEALIVER